MKKNPLCLSLFCCILAVQTSFAMGDRPPEPPPGINPATPEINLLPADDYGCPAPCTETHTSIQLRKEGRWLVDHHGRVVLLHGVNTVYKKSPFYPPDTADGFSAADARWLYDNGFNTVRAGTIFEGIMPQRGSINAAYLDEWDRVIQLLADNRQWTLLDFHQDMYNRKFQGNGFPDWAVYDYCLPFNSAVAGFPLNYFTSVVSEQYDKLYQDLDGVATLYGEAWQAVAAKWKDQPYLMGYDMINEPWPGTCWPSCIKPVLGCPRGDAVLQAFQTEIFNAIRAVDDQNIIWFEPSPIFDFGFPNHFDDTGIQQDGQVGFSFHSYCLAGMAISMMFSDIQDIPGCNISHHVTMCNARQTMASMDAVGLLSEFGASDDIEDIKNVTAAADDNLIGWQYWHYKNFEDPSTQSQESGAQSLFEDDADLGSLKTDKARVLIRPYPQYTAGIPLNLSFDPDTAILHYAYAPRITAEKTEVYVPTHIHYPNGYIVTASGVTHVQVTENGNRLIIHEEPDACEVTVDIKPYE